MNLLSLISMSLEFVYGSAALSNHDLIRLKRFVSQSEGYRMSFVSYSYLVLLISSWTLAPKKVRGLTQPLLVVADKWQGTQTILTPHLLLNKL